MKNENQWKGSCFNKLSCYLCRGMLLMFLVFSMYGCNNMQKNETFGFSGGVGTESNPFKVSTADDLTVLAKETNDGHLYTYSFYTMTNDIDLKNKDFMPIG